MAKQHQQRKPGDPRGLIDPADLDNIIRSCQETEAYCQLCESAGMDVGPERKKNQDQLSVAVRMKRAFFPNRT